MKERQMKERHMKAAIRAAAVATTMFVLSTPLHAQLLYVGVRGGAGVPSGTFADPAQPAANDGVLRGAKIGFGYGVDAGVGLGPLGVYAGYDRIDFDCDACASNAKYKLSGVSAGVRLGVPLFPIVKPWVKAGLTFNEINTTATGSGVTKIATDRGPGYEVGAGIDIPILGLFAISPQARYVGQKLDLKGLYSGAKTNVSYYTFDIGLKAKTPF
ncbi:MAG: outer membrane beta-barrel protein [Gemmatimonadaceae bacterium]